MNILGSIQIALLGAALAGWIEGSGTVMWSALAGIFVCEAMKHIS